MSNVKLRKTSEPSKRSMTSSMAAADDGDEENDEETRLLTGRSHSRSLSSPLEVETSAWTSRRSTAEDLASGDHKSRGSCAMTSYKGLVRRRRLTMSALVFVVFLPLITYLVVLIILGFVCALQKTGASPKLPCNVFDQWKTLRRSNIADFGIDMGLVSDLRTKASFLANPWLVLKGKDKARNSKVLFSGIIRNAQASLPTLTKDLDKLLGHFPNSTFVVCESCSTDATREILTRWQASQRSGEGREVLVPEPKQWSPVSYATKCAKKRDDPNRGVYGVRETVLAQLRNECHRYVKMTHAKEDYDYLVTLDMDIFRIDDQGVLDSFGAIAWMDDEESPWSAVCANGKYLNGIYRDTYAHRTEYLDTGEHFPKKVTIEEADGTFVRAIRFVRDMSRSIETRELVQRRVKDIVKTEKMRRKLYAVQSCFGGLTIYDMKNIQRRGCNYNGVSQYGTSRLLKPDCEHVSFNACVSGKNKVTFNSTTSRYNIDIQDNMCRTPTCRHSVLLNPRMQTWHGKGSWKLPGGTETTVVFLGYLMAALDAPLFLFPKDSIFVVSWVVVYLTMAATACLAFLCTYLIKRRCPKLGRSQFS